MDKQIKKIVLKGISDEKSFEDISLDIRDMILESNVNIIGVTNLISEKQNLAKIEYIKESLNQDKNMDILVDMVSNELKNGKINKFDKDFLMDYQTSKGEINYKELSKDILASDSAIDTIFTKEKAKEKTKSKDSIER